MVDDDPLVLLAVRSMLTRLECEVITAANGAVALEEVQKQNYLDCSNPLGLILMDVNMPVMNGYESASHIMRLIKNRQILPAHIVCLSAQDTPEHVKLCKEAGMEYLSKHSCY